ncbi:hypothetical protein ACRCUN_02145 [Mycobacterium sp. LTG2003]
MKLGLRIPQRLGVDLQQAGADELIVDLNLQDWFTSTRQMLETAVEIRERYVAS